MVSANHHIKSDSSENSPSNRKVYRPFSYIKLTVGSIDSRVTGPDIVLPFWISGNEFVATLAGGRRKGRWRCMVRVGVLF